MGDRSSEGLGAAALVVETNDHLIGTWRNVVIIVWKQETTLAGVDAGQKAYDDLAKANPSGVFLLTIVESGAPMPSSSVRDALARFLANGNGRTLLSGVAHEGTGFRAAAVRSVVTGLAVLGQLPYPHKVFATVNEAAAWFWGNSPVARAWGEQGKMLVDAVERLRARR
ncbi:MAG: hypothetical protein ABI551_24535 [Polyangiaceae bacterium]